MLDPGGKNEARGEIVMLESNACAARPKKTSEALCQYWHPVARSTEVTDKPVKVRLLDQPLALWRSNGQIAAFYACAFTVVLHFPLGGSIMHPSPYPGVGFLRHFPENS